MAPGRHLLASGVAVAAALAFAAAATARTGPVRTGSTPYVRLVDLHGAGLSIALTGRGRRAFRRVLRGYVLDASCTTLGKSVQGFTQSTGSTGASSGSIGPGRRPTYHVLLDRHADFCDVGRARQTINAHGESTTQVPGTSLESIALTQKGVDYLEEDRAMQTIYAVINALAGDTDPAGNFPLADKIAARLPGEVLALASPDASPPAGVTGVFSDRASHVEAVRLSPTSARLFIDLNGGILSTNAPEHLLRVLRGDVSLVSLGLAS